MTPCPDEQRWPHSHNPSLADVTVHQSVTSQLALTPSACPNSILACINTCTITHVSMPSYKMPLSTPSPASFGFWWTSKFHDSWQGLGWPWLPRAQSSHSGNGTHLLQGLVRTLTATGLTNPNRPTTTDFQEWYIPQHMRKFTFYPTQQNVQWN